MEKRKRPKVTTGWCEKIPTGCGNMYVTVAWDGDFLIESFAQLGKAGGCAKAQLEAVMRSVTLGLKYGVPCEEYIKQLKGISCPSQTIDDGVEVKSCAHAIALCLEKAVGKGDRDE